MKELLYTDEIKTWPVSSIAWLTKRTGIVVASLSVWYKYARKFGIFYGRTDSPVKKHKGFITNEPNQYLHVDTTFHTLKNGVKAAIVLVSDNFSRALLGWSVSTGKGAGNVIKALKMAVNTIRKCHPQLYDSLLMTDLGSENNNSEVDSFLSEQHEPELHKIIAQIDIRVSNSSIEAINRIYKKYLRHFMPDNIEELNNCTYFFEKDYNVVRPHVSIQGLTPMELYSGRTPEMDFTEKIRNALRIRKAENREHSCGIC